MDDDTRGIDDRDGSGLRERLDPGRHLAAQRLDRPRRVARRQARTLVIHDRAGGIHRRASTLGGRGRAVGLDVIGPPWRERVGVEPTAPR